MSFLAKSEGREFWVVVLAALVLSPGPVTAEPQPSDSHDGETAGTLARAVASIREADAELDFESQSRLLIAATRKPRRGAATPVASAPRSASAGGKPAEASDGHEDGEASSEADRSSLGDATNAARGPLTTDTLPTAMEMALRAVAGRSRWGVEVALAQTGQVLYQRGANEKFIPASNRKVFTGALALDQLGPDYKFRSYVYRAGNIRPDGTLEGNLVVLPAGDPTFSNRLVGRGAPTDWIFRDWVEKVKAAGIRNVTGDLLIDCSDWDLQDLAPKGWARRILSDSYAVTPSPLTINENLMGIKIAPGADGAPPVVTYFPPAEGYPIRNSAVSGKGGGAARVERLPTGPIEISGVVGKANELALPCDNATLFAAAVFRHRLREAGIMFGGTARIVVNKGQVQKPTPETLVAVYESPTMAELVKHMMKHSNNHFAEQLFVSVAAAKSGRGGYTEARRLEDTLLRRAGINTSDVAFNDGSGLSEANRVSPEQVVQLLSFMARHPNGQSFFDALAVSGIDGTLRGRMGSANLRGKVHGKTGFVNGVSCLSGYLLISQDKMLVFSFLVNDIRGGVGGPKAVQDRLCELLSKVTL